MSLPDLQPGQSACVIATPELYDQVTMQMRSVGLEVRDAVSIQTPDGSALATLVRRPFAATVVEQVVRYGRDHALDIQAGRISIDLNDPHMRPNADNHRRTTGGETYVNAGGLFDQNYSTDLGRHNSSGRFPANLVFVHGPDCECVGTKDYKPTNGSGTAHQNNKQNIGTGNVYEGGWSLDKVRGRGQEGYVSEDGTETIPDWNCQPNCPVRLMNGQSGKAGGKGPGTYSDRVKRGGDIYGMYEYGQKADAPDTYEDTGGASRFFYQAVDLDALKAYFRTLTGTHEPT